MKPGAADILACPMCKGSLDLRDGGLACARCAAIYPIHDGIPQLFSAENRLTIHLSSLRIKRSDEAARTILDMARIDASASMSVGFYSKIFSRMFPIKPRYKQTAYAFRYKTPRWIFFSVRRP